MTFRAGAARVDITPPLPVSMLGYSSRAQAARGDWDPLLGAPREILGEIGLAVRSASPSPMTLFAGYSRGSLGCVATPERYPCGDCKPAVSHCGSGHPAPGSPDVAAILRDTSLELLGQLFPEGSVADRVPTLRPPAR